MSGNETYLVSGTRNQAGAIGLPENFQEEVIAASSQQAYTTILEKPGFQHVHVVAIKMRCDHCGKAHITVPTSLYLGV
jgi:hypothetical protein